MNRRWSSFWSVVLIAHLADGVPWLETPASAATDSIRMPAPKVANPGLGNMPYLRTNSVSQGQALAVQMAGAVTLGGASTGSQSINSTSWTALGPAPIPNGQTQSRTDPVSGRVTAIAVHPTISKTIYVGTAQGGVYLTLDGGNTWTALMDSAQSLAIGALAIDPSNPSTVFVGTGEGNRSADSYFGVGIYRIINADTTPVLQGPFEFRNNGGNNHAFLGTSINRIIVDPNNDNNLFIASTFGVAGVSGTVTCCGGSSPASGYAGLFFCSNAQAPTPTFALVTSLPGNGLATVTDIAIEPGNANNLVLSQADFNSGATASGIYRSGNALSGATATYTRTLNFSGSQLNVKLALNKVGTTVTVLAATEESNGTLRRSTDGGSTWPTILNAANGFAGGQGFYDIVIALDPNTANTIYLGGSADSSPARMYAKSTDAGVTFNNLDTGLHADTHAFAIDPSNPQTVYIGNDGGIWKSTDSGSTWTSLNNATFSASQFESLALHPTDRNFMIGGLQDNGTMMMRSDGTWTRADFGDGGFALIDQNATDTVNLTMYHTYFNRTGQLIGFGRVTSIANAIEGNWSGFGVGLIADPDDPDGGNQAQPNGINSSDSVLFYAPMALGPGNPNTVYFGTDRLYRSVDRGATMTVVSQAPFSSGVPVSAIGISPKNDNVRIIGLTSGKVFSTTTGSSSMTDVTGSIPAKYIARAIIDPNNANTAYVALSGLGLPAGQHIWKNTNLGGGGGNWVAAGNGIPDVCVNGLVVDPRNSNHLYAGTDIGVYNSVDGGANWAPYGSGLPAVAVFDIAIQDTFRILRIATHGRGVWEIFPVIGLNNVPQLANIESGTLTYIENHAPTPVTGTITVSDVLLSTLVSGTVSITSGFAAGQDVLAMSPNPQNGISAAYNAATGVLSLSGTSSLANYQTALRSVTYFNSSDGPSTVTRMVTFKVNDGLADSTTQTRNVNVTPVNDPPVGTPTTISMLENSVYAFAATDFGLTDPLDLPAANNLAAVKITTLPQAGTLTDNGIAVTTGQFVSAADIGARKLRFTPVTDAHGIPYTSFLFQVQDDGGTANGGVDTDMTPRAMTVNVRTVNKPPVGISATVTTREDTAYTFATSDFGFSDPNDSPPDKFLAVKIASLPLAGILADNGSGLAAGQFVPVADITGGRLTFLPAANANGNNYASFTFQVQDTGGIEGGGLDTDTSAKTMTVNVTSVNDPPVGTSASVTTLQGLPYAFAVVDFGFSDPNDSPPNNLLAVRMTTLPAVGTLADNGAPVSSGQFVPAGDITAGRLTFTPAVPGSGNNYASFTFRVQDDGGTSNGGLDTDLVARTMTINLASVNGAPLGTSKALTILEDSTYVFGTGDFGFSDPFSQPANNFLAVKITTVPQAGLLADNGLAVTAGQFVPVTDIQAGGLRFTGAPNGFGNNYSRFTFQVQDDGGAANGADTDLSPKTMTINVTSVNDPPVGTPGTIATLEGAAYTFGVSDFGFTDPADTPANNFVAVKITALPQAGTLAYNGSTMTTGQFIPVSDLIGGKLKFTPAVNGNGNNYASFTFQLRDDGGTANGGIDTDPTPRLMTIKVTPVNNVPGFLLNFGATTIFTENFDGVTAGSLPLGWTSATTGSGVPWAASNTIKNSFPNAASVPDFISAQTGVIANSSLISPTLIVPLGGAQLSFVHSYDLDAPFDGGVLEISISGGAFQDILAAGGAFAAGGYNSANFYDGIAQWSGTSPGFTPVIVNLPAAARGANIQLRWRLHADDVNPRSFAGWSIDDIVITTGSAGNGITVGEDPGTVTASHVAVNLSAGPPDESGQLLNFIVANDNTALFSGQPAIDSSGTLTFTPAPNANGSATVSVRLHDNGGTANGGTDTSAPQSFTITVTAANDPPIGTSTNVSLIESATYTLALADFGFSDPNDTPANQFKAVKITTVPGLGTLKNKGTAVTAGQFVSVADISGGNLKFTPAAKADGNPYDSLTFQVQDDGGTSNGGVDTDPFPKTLSFNVTPVNDPPVGTSTTVTIREDTAYTFATTDFGFTDPVDNPPNNLLAVRFSSLPLAGTLSDDETAIAPGQFVSVSEISGGKLKFTPAANAYGNNYASFTFQVKDDGGTINGGVETDPTPRTFTINVTAANDPPQGTSTTITLLEDTSYTFVTGDFGFSDPNDTPANSFVAVRCSTLPSMGTLTDGGSLVTSGQMVLVADINGGKLKFTPAPNVAGANAASFNFQVQDDGGTANGGVDLDPSPKTVTINLTPVNDAPAGTPTTVTALEDNAYTFSTADFGFSDPKDTPANQLLAVKISTLPTAGTLLDSGTAVTSGQFIPVANITAGKLSFAPAPNANGNNYATFTFQVQDDGGTASGGVDIDPTARTVTISVVPVNDAPVGMSSTVTTLEDTAYIFATADFGFSDPNDAPPNSLLAVKITLVSLGAGTLSDNGIAVASGQFVSVSDIAGGRLRFVPTANANGIGIATFMSQVQDDGGTDNGGADTDPAARSLTINVTPVNDAPAGRSATVTFLEDTAYTFATADFGFSDSSDTPANNFLAVRIATLPQAGTLADNGVAVTAGQFVSAGDIAGGNLKFTPAPNGNGNNYARFTFQVQDDGGTASGGVDLDPSPKTVTFNVAPVNDAPAGASTTITALEDTVYTFATRDFGFSDPNDTPANNLLAVQIATLPLAGTLTDNGSAVSPSQSVNVSDIASGRLKFTAAANANGNNYASFTFRVQDDGGTANGGSDTDPVSRTMTINVTPVNDAPAGASATVATSEDVAYAFATGDFGFTDPNDTPPNGFLAVKIVAPPVVGALAINGLIAGPGQFVNVQDIAGGRLKYTPAPNGNGPNYASFIFQVQDDGGVAGGGTDIDPIPRTMTINVTPVNDPPTGASTAVTTLEDTDYVFATSDFGFSDPNDTPANHFMAVKISTLPAAGALKDDGTAVTAGQFVLAADISAGKLKFTPAANGNGNGYASFTFQVQDDGGTANGGVDTDTSPRTITVNVTPVNDAPAGTSTTVTVLENAAYFFAASDFGFTDPNDTPANNFLSVKFTTVPAAGTLDDGGFTVAPGQLVSVSDIKGGNLRFTPAANGSGNNYAGYTFQVRDDGGTGKGGANTDPSPKTMTINVVAVNHAPIGAPSAVTTLEDTAYTFATADFGFSDPNDLPANKLLAVRITTLPLVGTLTDNGTAVTAGQFVPVADLTSGRLRFAPPTNATGNNFAGFGFQVQDDGGTANGGADIDPSIRIMTINVMSVNDAPTGASGTVTTLENTAYTFTSADFGFSDPIDTPANNFLAMKLTTAPLAGSLNTTGGAVIPGQFVSISDITARRLVFTPAAGASGIGYSSFTFQVQDNGGTANGGIDLDQTVRTMTINVTAVIRPPTIGIIRSGSSVTLSWDAQATGFILEQATNIVLPITWRTVSGVNGTAASMTVTTNNQFFRLRHP